MKNQTIWIECSRCGKTFDYTYRGFGRKPNYCESCKVLVIKETKDRYEEKQKQLLNNQIKESGQVVDLVNKKAENQFLDYTTRTLDLLGQVDTLRVSMCNLLTELGEYQSNYDKQDQEFIHQVEANNFDNGTDALEFITKWQQDRKSRRNVKNLIKLLRDVVNVIPMKCKFTALNNIQNIKLKENNK